MDALTARVAAAVHAAFGPRFEPLGEPARRSIKCALLAGTLEGDAHVLAKQVVHPDPMWRWYFDREVALYRAFEREPPPVRAPRMYGADLARGVMLLERLPGPTVCPYRRATEPLPDATVDALIETRDKLVSWTERGLALAPARPPPPAVLASIRARLLEDPTAPLGWFRDGFARAGELGIVGEAAVRDMTEALARRPAVVFAHGDLLLRNAVRARDGAVVLVDWECAGAHPEGWDLALLWVGLHPANRPAVERAARRGGAGAWAGFLGAAAFGLAREIKFRGFAARRSGTDPALARLKTELGEVTAALAAALRG